MFTAKKPLKHSVLTRRGLHQTNLTEGLFCIPLKKKNKNRTSKDAITSPQTFLTHSKTSKKISKIRLNIAWLILLLKLRSGPLKAWSYQRKASNESIDSSALCVYVLEYFFRYANVCVCARRVMLRDAFFNPPFLIGRSFLFDRCLCG